jgi:L-galactose dehydrogenase
LELGVNTFDASPYYGRTRAESVLGRALAPIPRQDYVLMTKCGRNDVDRFDFRPEALERSVAGSLDRLGVEQVDVLQLHDVEFGDLDQVFDEALPCLRRLQQRGWCRYVGITGLPLAVFRRVLEQGIELDTALSYCHATLFDQTLLEFCPEFAARGIGLVNASPAAMGLLSSRGPQDWHPAPPEVRERCRQAAEHCREHGVEIAELALQYATQRTGIALTLCGTASEAEIEANVRAVERPIDGPLLAAVGELLSPIRNATWPQGRPENQS